MIHQQIPPFMLLPRFQFSHFLSPYPWKTPSSRIPLLFSLHWWMRLIRQLGLKLGLKDPHPIHSLLPFTSSYISVVILPLLFNLFTLTNPPPPAMTHIPRLLILLFPLLLLSLPSYCPTSFFIHIDLSFSTQP